LRPLERNRKNWLFLKLVNFHRGRKCGDEDDDHENTHYCTKSTPPILILSSPGRMILAYFLVRVGIGMRTPGIKIFTAKNILQIIWDGSVPSTYRYFCSLRSMKSSRWPPHPRSAQYTCDVRWREIYSVLQHSITP